MQKESFWFAVAIGAGLLAADGAGRRISIVA